MSDLNEDNTLKIKNLFLITLFVLFQFSSCYANSYIVTVEDSDLILPGYEGFKFITKENKALFDKFKVLIPPKSAVVGVYLPENELQDNTQYFSQYIIVFIDKKSYRLSNDNEWIQYRNKLIKKYEEKLLAQSLQIIKNDKSTGVVYQGLDLKVSEIEGEKIPFEIISNRNNAVSLLQSVSHKKVQNEPIIFVSEVSTIYLQGMIIYIDINKTLRNEEDIAWVKYLSNVSIDALLQLNSSKNFKKSKELSTLERYVSPRFYIFLFPLTILGMIVLFAIFALITKIYKAIFKIPDSRQKHEFFPASFREKYFSLNGELNQIEFISGILLLFAIFFAIGMIIGFIFLVFSLVLFFTLFSPNLMNTLPSESSLISFLIVLFLPVGIFLLYSFLILCVKRLKNTRLPATLTFLLLIPYVQIILVAILIFYSRRGVKRKKR